MLVVVVDVLLPAPVPDAPELGEVLVLLAPVPDMSLEVEVVDAPVEPAVLALPELIEPEVSVLVVELEP